jgi:hypothetical protein
LSCDVNPPDEAEQAGGAEAKHTDGLLLERPRGRSWRWEQPAAFSSPAGCGGGRGAGAATCGLEDSGGCRGLQRRLRPALGGGARLRGGAPRARGGGVLVLAASAPTSARRPAPSPTFASFVEMFPY